ncbi:MAG: TRZ/ATZ family hydrolase [Methylophilaceae bacterium]|nr:TRZ/ATZ family hydrolase [Methyloradius sp.]
MMMINQAEIKADLAIEARWVVPVVPHNQAFEYASVIIKDGRIIDVLSTESARQKYHAEHIVDLDEHILIPGLINLHTHSAMTLMRGLADDLPLMTWLNEHIWPVESKMLSAQFVHDGSLLGCAEMLSGGTTCFSDMYFYPQATAEAALQAGMRANLGLVVLDFATPYGSDADDYLQKGLESRDAWRGNPLLTASMAPHAPYTVSNSSFEKIITYAEQLGLGVHTHLHETQDELTQSITQYGVRPLRRLADLGLLGPNFYAAHGVHLDEGEIKMLHEYGCHIAHCPASNLKLASGIAPVKALLEQQVNVGIGTDGAASNNCLDMIAEMRLAALLAKGVTADATAVPAAQALQMATLNAARALGLDEQIGSIEVNKLADLTAVKIKSPETFPCYDPISHLVYTLGREHVSHVWVAGDLRYQKLDDQEGIFANIEPAELREINALWHGRLQQYK